MESHHTSVPLHVPRPLKRRWWPALKAHSFGLLFGAIWSLVGLPITTLGLVLMLLEPVPQALIPLLLGGLFAIAGVTIFLVALRRALQKQWLLEYGVQARARVHEARLDPTFRQNQKASTLLQWTFQGLQGQHQGKLHTFSPPEGWQELPGEEITVLFDPAHPELSASPWLMGIQFEEQPLPEDRRPSLDRARLPLSTPPRPTAARLRAHSPRARRSLLGVGGEPRGGLGELRWDEQGITWRAQAPQEALRLDWGAPLRLQLTAWPLHQGELELGVTLVQRQQGEARRIAFKVLLQQEQVDRGVPVQQVNAPWLEASAWEQLWPVLVHALEHHGEPPAGLLDVGQARPRGQLRREVAQPEAAQASARGR